MQAQWQEPRELDLLAGGFIYFKELYKFNCFFLFSFSFSFLVVNKPVGTNSIVTHQLAGVV
jgi:hypothetical protein